MKRAPQLFCDLGLLGHAYLIHVDAVTGYAGSDENVMAFVALHGILIIDLVDGLVLVGDKNQCHPGIPALLHAPCVRGVGTFVGGALGIADPAIKLL